MEIRVVLKGRAVYKCLLEGKKYAFKKDEPVVMHPSYAAIFGQKRDDNGKLLFEIIHGRPPKIISPISDKSEEAIDMAVRHKRHMKTRTTPGASRRFGRKKMPSKIGG